jgi:hypothetical protein
MVAEESLLHDVLGLRRAAQHPVREREEQGTHVREQLFHAARILSALHASIVTRWGCIP